MSHQLIGAHRELHPGQGCLGKRPPRRSRPLLGCAMATMLIAAGVGPAHAERLERADASGDMTAFTESSDGATSAPAPDHHAGDVTSAVLRHGRRAVTMRLTFAKLRRSHFNAVYGKLRAGDVTRIYVVEDEAGARPRLYVVNKRFTRACAGATLHVNYQADTTAIRVPRTCLQRPDWVKATAMSANDPDNGSNTFYLDDAFSATPVDAENRATWTARVKRR